MAYLDQTAPSGEVLCGFIQIVISYFSDFRVNTVVMNVSYRLELPLFLFTIALYLNNKSLNHEATLYELNVLWHANNKGAGQSVYLHRLTSAFVFRCFGSIIPIFATFK